MVERSVDYGDPVGGGADHQPHELQTTSPYGSTSFGSVGAYQQLACTANGAVDPNDPLNAIIQDIQLAPKVGGLVQYSMDVTILMPTDLGKSNQVMLFDVPNRGNRLLPGGFNIGCAYRLSHPNVVPMETAARRPGRLDCAISWLVQKTLPEPGDLRTLPHPGRATSTADNLLGPPAGTTWYRVRADFLGPAPHHQPGWHCRDVWRDQACKHYPDSGFARKYCGFV